MLFFGSVPSSSAAPSTVSMKASPSSWSTSGGRCARRTHRRGGGKAAGRCRERGEEMCRAEDLGDALLQFCSVVLSAPLDGLYEGLPVIVVDKWREFCEMDIQERRREAAGRCREREGDIHGGVLAGEEGGGGVSEPGRTSSWETCGS